MLRRTTALALTAILSVTTAIGVFWWEKAKAILIGFVIERLGLAPDKLSLLQIGGLVLLGLLVAFLGWLYLPDIKRRVASDNGSRVKAWLHPKEAYKQLANRRLYQAWVQANQDREQAEQMADAIVHADLMKARDKAIAAGVDAENVFSQPLERFGYGAPNPELDAWTSKSAKAWERRQDAEGALDKDFVDRLERGDLLAEGVRTDQDTSEIIDRAYWRGAKLDKEMLFDRKLEAGGRRWNMIAIGKKV